MSETVSQSVEHQKVNCDACPILCRISPGKTGSCDRYGNIDGKLQRLDPVLITQRTLEQEQQVVPFLESSQGWDGSLMAQDAIFPTAVGSGTTYPDYKPAPFIIGSEHEGVDMVTVVTEGIFSYCSIKVKIDTDRYIGPEQASVRCEGEEVGHVMTAEYGSQMLSLGESGISLEAASRKEGSPVK